MPTEYCERGGSVVLNPKGLPHHRLCLGFVPCRSTTGWFLSIGAVGCLMARGSRYERNASPRPMVYRLSEKALSGS